MQKRIVFLLALTVTFSCTRVPAPAQERKADAATAVPDSLLASVESVEMATVVAPDETLRVRVRGVVGPDGSWAADGVGVRRAGDRITLEPRVRRVAGDAFIQMLIPLDATVPLRLEPGSWTLEVRGREGASLPRRVEVRAGARRAPPVVRLEAGAPAEVQGGAMVPVRVHAESPDGWVARLEVRGVGADSLAWTDPGSALATGTALEADLGVLRPPRDGHRRIEARAIDGQGTPSAIAVLELPARSE